MSRSTCPVCGSDATRIFLDRDNVPAHQNLLFADAAQAVQMARGHLAIALCASCGFVFNADFSPEILSYGSNYDNAQDFSPAFEDHLNRMADFLVHEKGLRDCRIVEIGCGQGTFLRKLVERGNNSGLGLDPSYAGPLEDLSGRLRFKKEFYNERSPDMMADAVICRHVIEHIPEPTQILIALRKSLQGSPGAALFFETPDVEWILSNGVGWDFFYEHCSYFSARSIRTAFAGAGFSVAEVGTVFGDQYLWTEARPAIIESAAPLPDAQGMATLVKDFEASNARITLEWTQRLSALCAQGGAAIWGAGAKGVTFANLFDPHRELIACVVDVNPNKQGKYLPGTGHPILAPGAIPRDRVRTLIVMNPNYGPEIASRVRSVYGDAFSVLDSGGRSVA